MRIAKDLFSTPELPQLVIFDMDNTIANREHHFSKAFIETISTLKAELSCTADEIKERFLGKSITECWEFIRAQYLFDKTESEQSIILEGLKSVYLNKVTQTDQEAHQQGKLFFTDTINLMKWCFSKNIPMCIVSGSSRQEIQSIIGLGELPIEHYWGAEDYAPYSKPDPTPYNMAVKEFGMLLKEKGGILNQDHVVVIEDSIAGAQSATTAGLHCIVRCNNPAYREKLQRSVVNCVCIVEKLSPSAMILPRPPLVNILHQSSNINRRH